jgi:hypothetical protein
MGSIIRVAWSRWRLISEIYGDYFARFFTFIFYFTIIVPFALITRFLVDPLKMGKAHHTQWLQRKPVGTSLEEARSQS